MIRETPRTHIGLLALCRRESLRVLKIGSQTIAAPTLTAMLFLIVFGASLGSRIGTIDSMLYTTYILPGVIMMQVVTQSFGNNAASVFQGKNDGFIDDILSAPVHAFQISIGYLWGGLLRSMSIAVLVFVLSIAVTGYELASPIVFGVVLVLTSILWGSVGVIAGMWADTFDQHMLIGNLVITPLVFIGGVFYSVEMLSERLETFSTFNPLLYQVSALRQAMLGVGDFPLGTSFSITAGMAIVAFSVQLVLLSRGWKITD